MTSHPIPSTLDEAVDTLVASLSQIDRAYIEATPRAEFGPSIHMSAGMALRNELHLWQKDAPLSVWFRARGVWHGDDMSAIILDALWCCVHEVAFDLDAEVAYYTAFWARHGQGFDGESISGHVEPTSWHLTKDKDGHWTEEPIS